MSDRDGLPGWVPDESEMVASEGFIASRVYLVRQAFVFVWTEHGLVGKGLILALAGYVIGLFGWAVLTLSPASI